MSERHAIANGLLLREVCTLLAEGRRVKLRAKGGSMRPFIRGGEDILVLSPPMQLRRGDIVLARKSADEYVVHRIVRMTRGCIVLAGDANLYLREECRPEDICGVAETLIRHGRQRSLTAPSARLYALVWHSLLPFRRLGWRVRSMIAKRNKVA